MIPDTSRATRTLCFSFASLLCLAMAAVWIAVGRGAAWAGDRTVRKLVTATSTAKRNRMVCSLVCARGGVIADSSWKYWVIRRHCFRM